MDTNKVKVTKVKSGIDMMMTLNQLGHESMSSCPGGARLFIRARVGRAFLNSKVKK